METYNEEKLELLLDQSINKNIMCYDNNSTGELSKRLIAILLTAYRRTYNKKAKFLFIDKYYEHDIIMINNDLDNKKILGVEIILTDLDGGSNLYKKFIDKGTFPSRKSNLCILSDEDMIMGILGAY